MNFVLRHGLHTLLSEVLSADAVSCNTKIATKCCKIVYKKSEFAFLNK